MPLCQSSVQTGIFQCHHGGLKSRSPRTVLLPQSTALCLLLLFATQMTCRPCSPKHRYRGTMGSVILSFYFQSCRYKVPSELLYDPRKRSASGQRLGATFGLPSSIVSFKTRHGVLRLLGYANVTTVLGFLVQMMNLFY